MSTNSLQPLVLHAHGTGTDCLNMRCVTYTANFTTCPNPYKVAILLEALDIAYTVKLWTFAADSSGVKGPEFLKINPNGRVPALEDPNTGVTSWESGACIAYILRVYDRTNKLGPRADDEPARVEFDTWIAFLLSTLGPMMGQVNWFRHYNPSKNEDALQRYEKQAYRCFEVLEGHLKAHGGEWILKGKGPTAADFHFYPWILQHGFAELSLDAYPTVGKWLERTKGLAEVTRAYKTVSEGQQA